MQNFSLETSPLLPSSPTTSQPPHLASSSSTLSCKNNNSSSKSLSSSLYLISSILLLIFFLLFINSPPYHAPSLSDETMTTPAGTQESETLSIFTNKFTGSYEIIRGRKDPNAEANANFQLNIENAGWNYLEIEATPQDDSMENYLKSMRAMGYLEGFLTWKQIEQFYPNYYQGMFDTLNPTPVDPDPRLQKYLLDNFHWMAEKSKAKYTESAHWLTVRGIVEQLEGLVDGFIDGRQEYRTLNGLTGDDDVLDTTPPADPNEPSDLSNPSNLNGNLQDNTHLTTLKHPYILHFMLLNSNGDLYQVVEKMKALDDEEGVANLKQQQNLSKTKSSSLQKRKLDITDTADSALAVTRLSLMKSSHAGDHCSAFIKVLPDQSDVIFAHNTWDDYRSMGPRIFKHYIFPPWPLELKKEERQKDTFVKYTAERKSDKHKKKHGKHNEKETEEKHEEISIEDDHCLCPANQYSKPLPKASSDHTSSDKEKKSQPESQHQRYHFAPHSYFSSSPGVLTSVDDFYTTYTSPNLHIEENQDKNCYCEGPGGRLGIMETSLDVKSPELYDLIKPESLLSWIRVRSANLIAIDGQDWISKFSYDHSGTYANQWMIIDFTKFEERGDETQARAGEGNVLNPGFLTIIEEMPGMIHSGDETKKLLSQGYWASYNEPYFSELSDYSGNSEYCEATRLEYAATHDPKDPYGLWPGEVNCYETCSRARLFHRLQSSVENIHDAMSLITYNNFQDDQESFNDSCESISCREDLQPGASEMRAFGAVDAKVSSILRSDIYRDLRTPLRPTTHASFASFHHIYPREPEIYIHQGPTTSSQQPFCWDQFEEKQNNYYSSIRDALKETLDGVKGMIVEGANSLTMDDDQEEGDEKNENDQRMRLRGLSSQKEKDGRGDVTSPVRNRHPSIKYNHFGQPNCFDYDWVIVPPAGTP